MEYSQSDQSKSEVHVSLAKANHAATFKFKRDGRGTLWQTEREKKWNTWWTALMTSVSPASFLVVNHKPMLPYTGLSKWRVSKCSQKFTWAPPIWFPKVNDTGQPSQLMGGLKYFPNSSRKLIEHRLQWAGLAVMGLIGSGGPMKIMDFTLHESVASKVLSESFPLLQSQSLSVGSRSEDHGGRACSNWAHTILENGPPSFEQQTSFSSF